MLTFVKLGGSLVTDKRVENSFRADVAARVAGELHDALTHKPDLRLLIGHGSGSFGHVPAKQHGTIKGVATPEQWRGFAEVAATAAELNRLMLNSLRDAGIDTMRFQASASARCVDGVIASLSVEPIRQAIEHRLVPLVYGDVAFDDVRGGTIASTETIFFYLAQHLPVEHVLLLGEVEGVYDADGIVIPHITPETLPAVEEALGGSAGTDVTGGMETKVRDMVRLVEKLPGLSIRIMSGQIPGLLHDTLIGAAAPGTLISAR